MTRLYLSNGRCPESFHCQLVSSDLTMTAMLSFRFIPQLKVKLLTTVLGYFMFQTSEFHLP